MTPRRELAYVQARLQAWHGRRPAPASWRSLETATDLQTFLNAARRTSLRPWVARLNRRMDSRAIERSLRAEFRAHVLRVARWSPRRWHAPVAWCACLPDLEPARHHAERGGDPEWVGADAWLAMQLSGDRLGAPFWLRRILARPGLPAWPGTDPAASWLAIWRSLVADCGRGAGPSLERVAQAIGRHLDAMRSADAAAASGDALRDALAHELAHLLRLEAERPAALFCHLGLVALDLIRLRGAVLERRLFGPPTPAAA